MAQFDIRVRLSSSTSPQFVTELAEAIEEFMEDNAPEDCIMVNAGPVDGDSEWEITAQDNLNEMMD